MPDVVRELLATEAALGKLGARGISAEQVPHHRHTMIRNPNDPGDSGERQLLVGCTDGGRV